jgi:hypothetical protein
MNRYFSDLKLAYDKFDDNDSIIDDPNLEEGSKQATSLNIVSDNAKCSAVVTTSPAPPPPPCSSSVPSRKILRPSKSPSDSARQSRRSTTSDGTSTPRSSKHLRKEFLQLEIPDSPLDKTSLHTTSESVTSPTRVRRSTSSMTPRSKQKKFLQLANPESPGDKTSRTESLELETCTTPAPRQTSSPKVKSPLRLEEEEQCTKKSSPNRRDGSPNTSKQGESSHSPRSLAGLAVAGLAAAAGVAKSASLRRISSLTVTTPKRTSGHLTGNKSTSLRRISSLTVTTITPNRRPKQFLELNSDDDNSGELVVDKCDQVVATSRKSSPAGALVLSFNNSTPRTSTTGTTGTTTAATTAASTKQEAHSQLLQLLESPSNSFSSREMAMSLDEKIRSLSFEKKHQVATATTTKTTDASIAELVQILNPSARQQKQYLKKFSTMSSTEGEKASTKRPSHKMQLPKDLPFGEAVDD